MPASLAAVSASKEAFVQAVGGCYEKSPWVAERAFAQGPFESVTALAAAMKQTLANATDDEVLSLLRAHPDLAGKAALKGDVTAESASEQARAGLGSLTAEELSKTNFTERALHGQVRLPFILAVRNASKRVIFAALERRMAGDTGGACRSVGPGPQDRLAAVVGCGRRQRQGFSDLPRPRRRVRHAGGGHGRHIDALR